MPAKRVVIIDDEADIREVVALALECSGVEVMAAEGGLAGLRAALERCPDLILLDVMMPELDGPSTFRLLRQAEATRAVPVIFLTAKVQAADQRNLIALGALGIIAKPFDPMRLVEEISALAGWTSCTD